MVLSPQLKLILRYFYFITLSHEFFITLNLFNKKEFSFILKICVSSFLCGVKSSFFNEILVIAYCGSVYNVLP